MNDRYNIFANLDETEWNFYKRATCAFWTCEELDITRDRESFATLTPQEKHLVKMVLAFATPADGAVGTNLAEMIQFQKSFASSAFLNVQMAIETIHSEAYASYVEANLTPEEKEEVYQWADTNPVIKRQLEFMERYKEANLAERYLAYTCAEGIFFCVLFLVVFSFRSQGKLQTLIFMNEQISKDESLHRDFGSYRFRKEIAELGKSAEEFEHIVDEAVAIQDELIDLLLPEPVQELNRDGFRKYIREVADNLRYQCGMSVKYKVKSPYTWMSDIAIAQKGNFFEVRTGSYKQVPLSHALNWKKRLGVETESLEEDDDI